MVNALHIMYLVGIISLLVLSSFAEPRGLRRKRKALEMKDVEQYFQEAGRLLHAEPKGVKKVRKKSRRTLGEISEQGIVYLSFHPIPEEPTPAPRPTTDPQSTTQPTNLPCDGLTRDEALLELLSTVTPEEQLLDSSTPQGTAYNWLRVVDTSYNPCTYPTMLQRYALAVFYFSTEGNRWDINSGWVMSMNECEWYGVDCRLGNGMVTAFELRKCCWIDSPFLVFEV